MTQPSPEEAATPVQERVGHGRRDLLAGVAVALGGVVLLVAALLIPEPARASPGLGPRALPVLVSSLLVLSGGLLAVLALRGREGTGIEDDIMPPVMAERVDDLIDPDEPAVPWRPLAVVVAMFVAYAVVFIPLGYMLSTALFLFAVTTFVHPAKWLRNGLYAVLFAVLVYYLFTRVLFVQLPSGLLG